MGNALIKVFTVRYPLFSSKLSTGEWLDLSTIQLLHRAPTGGDLRSAGGVRLDGLFGRVNPSPWLPGLPVCGGGPDGRLVYWLGEEERGDAEPHRRSGGRPCQEAAEGERGTGEGKKTDVLPLSEPPPSPHPPLSPPLFTHLPGDKKTSFCVTLLFQL